MVSGFRVKSVRSPRRSASITATAGVEEPNLTALLRNRTPTTGTFLTAAARERVRTSLKNVRTSPGGTRTRRPVDGCAFARWTAVDDSVSYQVSGSCFSLRPQSRYGDARRPIHRLPVKARERPLCGREQEHGGGIGGRAERDRREWRAGNWEDRRPEASADGRKRAAVRGRSR